MVARQPAEKTKGDVAESGGSGRSPARTIGLLVVLGLVAAFVVQNSQTVLVHLWFVTERVRLLWLVLVAFVAGGVGEALVRRGLRTRFRGRRQKGG
jgi:uncharacterized integral membrane protein